MPVTKLVFPMGSEEPTRGPGVLLNLPEHMPLTLFSDSEGNELFMVLPLAAQPVPGPDLKLRTS